MAVLRRTTWPAHILCLGKLCMTSRGLIPRACPLGRDGREPAVHTTGKCRLARPTTRHSRLSIPLLSATSAIWVMRAPVHIFPASATGMPFVFPLRAQLPTELRSPTFANSRTRPRRMEHWYTILRRKGGATYRMRPTTRRATCASAGWPPVIFMPTECDKAALRLIPRAQTNS